MNEQRLVPRIKFRAFKDTWKKEKLGSLSDIVRGASPRPIQDKKWFSKDSNIGWLRISDVTEQNGKIYHLEQKLSPLGQEKTRVVKNKHLLLSIAATVGSPVINYIPTGVHDGFLIFLNPQFNIDFMFQWLTYYRNNWAKYGQPGSQVNLNSKIVKNQRIYIPGLNEQQKIGDFFAKLDRLLGLQQQKLDQLELLKKALLQKLFPKQDAKIPELRFKGFAEEWKTNAVQEISKIVGGGTPDTNKADYWNGDINWYSPTEIGKKPFAYSSNKKISKIGLKKSSAKLLPANKTVLFTSRAGIGDMAILKTPAATNQGFQSLELKDNVYPYFVYSYGFEIKRKAKKLASGSTFLEISNKDMKRITLEFPNVKEQQKIGNLLAKVDRLIELENKKFSNLKLVKKSLLQNMFVE